MTVTGSYLDSVAEPRITVNTTLYSDIDSSFKTETNSEVGLMLATVLVSFGRPGFWFIRGRPLI